MEIQIEVTPQGGIQMLHDDAVDLREFGPIEVSRASHVEFENSEQMWRVTSARTGKILCRAMTRSAALAWEKQHFSPGGEGWAEMTK